MLSLLQSRGVVCKVAVLVYTDQCIALLHCNVCTHRYYLSPELCADMPYRDKSDCWAMGVLIYEVIQFIPFLTKFLFVLVFRARHQHIRFPVLQCATLQHPFEARNQCALIMKIIEAQVKIPAGTIISIELRNLILWLLQKDPNLRPSVKDILNEVCYCTVCTDLSCLKQCYELGICAHCF